MIEEDYSAYGQAPDGRLIIVRDIGFQFPSLRNDSGTIYICTDIISGKSFIMEEDIISGESRQKRVERVARKTSLELTAGITWYSERHK